MFVAEHESMVFLCPERHHKLDGRIDGPLGVVACLVDMPVGIAYAVKLPVHARTVAQLHTLPCAAA